jgi:hypothetical protein
MQKEHPMMRSFSGWFGVGYARHGPGRILCAVAAGVAAIASPGLATSEANASTGARSALAPVAPIQHDAYALGTMQIGELRYTAYADGRLLVDQLASMLASLGYGAATSGNSLHFSDAHALPTLRWHPGQIDAEFFPEGTGGRVSLRIDFFETGTRVRSPLAGHREFRSYEPAPTQVVVVHQAPPPPRTVVVHQPVYVPAPVVCRPAPVVVCSTRPVCSPVVHTRSVVYRNAACNEAVYRRPSYGPTVSIRVESHRSVCSSSPRSFHRPHGTHQPAFDSHISRSGPRGARPR